MHVPCMYHAYYCCRFAFLFLYYYPKLTLVMKGNELEIWIALLATWNFITVQSNC